mmetsp:Transcript_32136/g.73931  ORF Transcript_32136/g.73931 Transcript_32136/m.73931 type:complete len:270 (+) Transcript_32136:1354-2163(+)
MADDTRDRCLPMHILPHRSIHVTLPGSNARAQQDAHAIMTWNWNSGAGERDFGTVRGNPSNGGYATSYVPSFSAATPCVTKRTRRTAPKPMRAPVSMPPFVFLVRPKSSPTAPASAPVNRILPQPSFPPSSSTSSVATRERQRRTASTISSMPTTEKCARTPLSGPCQGMPTRSLRNGSSATSLSPRPLRRPARTGGERSRPRRWQWLWRPLTFCDGSRNKISMTRRIIDVTSMHFRIGPIPISPPTVGGRAREGRRKRRAKMLITMQA